MEDRAVPRRVVASARSKAQVYQLVYVSSAAVPLSTDDLLFLLEQSRANNERSGLTGLLLHKDGNFMQVLEGEEEAVRATHARISLDSRHKGMITLLQGPIDARQFPEWSMALRRIRSADALSVPGYSEFLNTPLTGREFSDDPSRCQRLLLAFKKNTA